MINLGPTEILLKPGMSICQLIIEEVKGIPVQAPNQFTGQQNVVGNLPNPAM
jgi:deoxycytidine triphosphate deaminase